MESGHNVNTLQATSRSWDIDFWRTGYVQASSSFAQLSQALLGSGRRARHQDGDLLMGAKVFMPGDVPETNSSGMPEQFRDAQRKRYNRKLGDFAGLKNFGVNLVRVAPGGQSSARHSHTKQDEFVYVLKGEFVLVANDGRQVVGPGTCVGFPFGTGNGHHLLNESTEDAVLLVVGDRTPGDFVTYSDIDLEFKVGPGGRKQFCRKDGTPYETKARD
jgi:uncharacterized cupin superfamily protein